MRKCPKLQFLKQPQEAPKSKSIPIELNLKMLNFTSEINMFTATTHGLGRLFLYNSAV